MSSRQLRLNESLYSLPTGEFCDFSTWKGTFYSVDTSAKGMLRYYGERFRTVEIVNSNFVFHAIKQNLDKI